MAVIFVPILYFFAQFDFLETNINAILGLGALLLITTILFWFLAPPFLALFGTRFTVFEIAEAYGYAVSPLAPLILLYYAVNLLIVGRLSGILYVITGVRDAFDWLLPALPVLHVVGQIIFINVFFRALRIMKNLPPVYALMLAIVSAVPFYGSLLLVTLAAGYFQPELADVIWRFLWLFVDAW